MKQLMLIMSALVLIVGSAHARLGWTLEQCENIWGSPVKVQYNEMTGATYYNFMANANLYPQIYILNGIVEDIEYCSRNKTYLKNIAEELLQKNYPGVWSLYDDGRGRRTLHTWKVVNQYGDMMAYAIFSNEPDSLGYYHLQVSSAVWGNFISEHNWGQNPVVSSGSELNVQAPQQTPPVVNVQAPTQAPPTVNVQIPQQAAPVIHNTIVVSPATAEAEKKDKFSIPQD